MLHTNLADIAQSHICCLLTNHSWEITIRQQRYLKKSQNEYLVEHLKQLRWYWIDSTGADMGSPLTSLSIHIFFGWIFFSRQKKSRPGGASRQRTRQQRLEKVHYLGSSYFPHDLWSDPTISYSLSLFPLTLCFVLLLLWSYWAGSGGVLNVWSHTEHYPKHTNNLAGRVCMTTIKWHILATLIPQLDH